MRSQPEPTVVPELNPSSAEERLRLALTAGRVGTWELTLEGPPRLELSPELQSILGMQPLQFDGKIRGFLQRVHPADRSAVVKQLRHAVQRVEDPELEFRFLTSNALSGWLLGRGRIHFDSAGRPARLLGVGIEITAQKMAELEISRLNAQLEQRVADRTAQLQAANKELDAFCYSVSHDLRAPLRSVRGFMEVLLERYAVNLDARGREFLRRACEASRHMDQLIDSLLKLSRVGRSELSRRLVDLSKLATSIAHELSVAEPDRRVKISVAAELTAVGDERLLRLVLENLLANAWKFTSKKDEALIEFGSTTTPDKAFFVRDNGAGFDPAYAARLFGVFQRLHSANEFPGNGVGLATVQRIITRHGGRLWATGAVDEGATFYFVLPNETI